MSHNLTIDEFYATGKATSLEMRFLDAWFTHAPQDAPEPLCQYRYADGRKLEADFAWPESRVLVECEGGVTNRRAHGSVGGIIRDIDRCNAASANGWRRFRCWVGMLEDAEKRAEFVRVVATAVLA